MVFVYRISSGLAIAYQDAYNMLCQEWASLTQPSEMVTFGLEVAPKEKGVGHPCGQSEHMSNH